MKMTFIYFVCGFITALVLSTGGLALVYTNLKRKRNRSQKIEGYLDLIADLTQQQKSQVQEIRRVFLPRVANIRQNLYMERAELAKLLFAEPPDRERIRGVADMILQHQSELENEVIEHILEERQILTPQQERKFYSIIVEQFGTGGLGVHDVKGRRI